MHLGNWKVHKSLVRTSIILSAKNQNKFFIKENQNKLKVTLLNLVLHFIHNSISLNQILYGIN